MLHHVKCVNMNKLNVILVCLMLSVIPSSQVSADADESDPVSDVTVGFGNVTNDTMEFTMDTSVDVYSFQVTLAWETGAVYCGISGSGGLAEEYSLYVSVMYAGCLTTGYYYGAQGNYYIPSGSNDTLTSIWYQSNSPEVCIGNATYTIMLDDGEFETRQAGFDPNDCLSYTMYESEWPYDLWYELNDDESDSEAEVSYSNGEVIIGYGDVTNDTMVLTIDTNVDIFSFDISVQSMYCGDGFGGAAEDANLSVSTTNDIGMGGNSGCNILGNNPGNNTSYIPAGTDEDLTAWLYQGGSEEICIMYAFYTKEEGGSWFEADLDANYCLDYTFVYPDNSWYSWFELNEDQSNLEIDEYGISVHDTVLWTFQNSPYFSTLIQALEMTNLTDVLSPENTPQMGYTVFAPTNEAFNASGIILDDFNSSLGIEVLTEILLYHVSFAGAYSLDMSMAYNSSSGEYEPYCEPYTIDWMPMQNGELADPFNYSSWTETVVISNDCQGDITVEQANVIDADNRVYGYYMTTDWPSSSSATDNGMIQVIDRVLIPSSLNFTPPNNDEPRFNPRFDIPSNLDQDGEFNQLIDALSLTYLMDDVTVTNSPEMGMTIFAPTDTAFAEAGINTDEYDTLEGLMELNNVLLSHISFDWVLSFSDDCVPSQFDLETADERLITVSNDCDGNISVNGATILYSQEVENGVIHVIDKVLMPLGDITEIAAGTGIHTSLVAALVQAELVETLQGDGPFTVFAPTDQAFTDAGIDLAALDTPEGKE
ncbi:MAG: fasciclin domain-containing protein, partial [Euryarchaeota archaeon]|nr:fasciclin domain-containing protein [Euryarchaeota archaeon]